MSGPLVPQVYASEMRRVVARQHAFNAVAFRDAAKRHAKRLRNRAALAQRRLAARAEAEARS